MGVREMRKIALWLIVVYQKIVSPYLGPQCRFEPTCSRYTSEAITRYGLLRGVFLGGCRLLKCHPFHPGGIDPVP